jgi:serine/threonine protein kinase
LIIHRDVKSSNILMTKDIEGKMLLFGISKLNNGAGNKVATRIIGRLRYMDPE